MSYYDFPCLLCGQPLHALERAEKAEAKVRELSEELDDMQLQGYGLLYEKYLEAQRDSHSEILEG